MTSSRENFLSSIFFLPECSFESGWANRFQTRKCLEDMEILGYKIFQRWIRVIWWSIYWRDAYDPTDGACMKCRRSSSILDSISVLSLWSCCSNLLESLDTFLQIPLLSCSESVSTFKGEEHGGDDDDDEYKPTNYRHGTELCKNTYSSNSRQDTTGMMASEDEYDEKGLYLSYPILQYHKELPCMYRIPKEMEEKWS